MTKPTLKKAAYDLFAPFYDMSYADRSNEIAFYRSLLRPEDRAYLELGCGSGRIVGSLANDILKRHGDSARLVGLDISNSMLSIAHSRYPRIEWVHGDMTAPVISGKFDMVTCPLNTLHLLPSDDDILRVFEAVQQLLTLGGVFVFDIYNASYIEPESNICEPTIRTNRVVRTFRDESGLALEVREDAQEDPEGKYVQLDWTVVRADNPGGAALATLNLRFRFYTYETIKRLVESAGLQIQACYGDILKSEFNVTGSKKLVAVCALAT